MRTDGGNIWKTAFPVPNKIGDMCRQIVLLQYFGCYFNISEWIAVAFATSFEIERKLELRFSL